jgi:hypothetical protein
MLVCAACGFDGASYCTLQDENGNSAGEYFHPVCLARKSVEESNKREAKDFAKARPGYIGKYNGYPAHYTSSAAIRAIPARCFAGTRAPYSKGPTVFQVRL